MFTLTSQYKRGIIKLAVLIGLLCFFIIILKVLPVNKSEFLLDTEAQCFVDNQKMILADTESKKEYTYYVNSITDYAGYQLGLSVEELDRLFAFREKQQRIYNLIQFKEVTGISKSKLDSIKHLLVFPKPKKIFKKAQPSKKVTKAVKIKRDINKVSSKELYARFNFPSVIANRVVNYRESIKGFQSMKQLNAVYDISKEQIDILKMHYEIKK